MKIHITFDVGDDERKAVARRRGDKGKASWSTMKNWIEQVVAAELQEVRSELQ